MLKTNDSSAVLHRMNEGVVAFDAHRKVVLVNPAAAVLMGWAEQDAVGCVAGDLLKDWPEMQEVVQEAFQGCLRSRPVDLIRRESDGRVRHLGVSTSLLEDEGGVVLVIQDLSELKRSEWEMFQAGKMEALGRLAASVAHEVRNPLGAIDIQLQLLGEDLAEVEPGFRQQLYRRLNIAQMEMKRLDRIVHNFLRFSRTPRLALQLVSLNDVVRHVFELVSPEAREQEVRLKLDLQEDLPQVDGDESQLGQAVLNMIVNAFQAIQGSGKVRASTREESESGQICLALSDSGCGIAEDEIDRIFEFYYTTKDEGTGLGLSIAQRIIYQHGGHIEVESQEGEGTTFRVYLPIAKSQVE